MLEDSYCRLLQNDIESVFPTFQVIHGKNWQDLNLYFSNTSMFQEEKEAYFQYALLTKYNPDQILL
ncbi:hypothetical protein D3C81_2270970 [compost metagenome]